MFEVGILVVADDRRLSRLIENSLCRLQARVHLAGNAREAFQLLMEYDFSLCVVDLDMVNLDIIAFLQEALKVWPWLGVVALASEQDDRLEELWRIGDFKVVEKPFTFELLSSRVLTEYRRTTEQPSDQDRRENIDLAKFQYNLRGLRKLIENAMQADTLVDSLRSLCMGIGQILPFAIVAVMGSDDEYAIIFNLQKPVSERFVEQVGKTIHNRYESLTGRTVDWAEIKIEKAGLPVDAQGASEIGSTFSVPVITANELRGIITIATLPDNHYTTADTTFMYYAANQLSTVFTAMTQIRHLAIRDPMTGLFNRLQLDREIEKIWREYALRGCSLAVAVMDLDHFKTVNDTYGHLVGDNVLREFATLLKKSCDQSYVLGRYGGEEFVIIMPDVDQEQAVECAASFLKKVREHVFCQDKTPLHVTVSIGLSFFTPTREIRKKQGEELLSEADQAMYMAKRAGRDCLRIWSGKEHSSEPEPEDGEEEGFSLHSMYRIKRREPGIMIIEDDYALRKLLQSVIGKEGYRVEAWGNPAAALEQLKANPSAYDLIVTEMSLPELRGMEIMREVHAVDETLIVIMIAGYGMIDGAVECMRFGAYDILHKPFQFKQVSAIIRRALEYRRTILENRQYEQHLLEMVKQHSAKVTETMEEIKTSYNFTLEALVGLLDAREKDSGNHSKRVRDLTLLLARRMGIVGERLEDISRGALLHDIGKIGVPDAILLKQGKLTEAEWRIMREHPTIGYRILQHSSYLQNAAEIVYSHQEKWDGSGYPRGLRGGDICLGARIFAVVDAYDAMRTDRHYRNAMPSHRALAEIKSQSSRQFDPEVVDAFLKHQREMENLLRLLYRKNIEGIDE